MNLERLWNSKIYQSLIDFGYLVIANTIALCISVASAGFLLIPSMISLSIIAKHSVDDHSIQLMAQFFSHWKISAKFMIRYTLTVMLITAWWVVYAISVAMWISGGDYLFTAWMFAGFGLVSFFITLWIILVSLVLHQYFPNFGVYRLLRTSVLIIRRKKYLMLVGYSVLLAIVTAVYFAPFLIVILPVYGMRLIISMWNSFFNMLGREEESRLKSLQEESVI